MAKRASYREGVWWVAFNDDPGQLDAEEVRGFVSVLLLADLFGKDEAHVARDVVRLRRARDAQPRRLAGQCLTGAERDGGRIYHAVPTGPEPTFERAVCGAKPGRLSAGWSDVGEAVTCPRCLRALERLP